MRTYADACWRLALQVDEAEEARMVAEGEARTLRSELNSIKHLAGVHQLTYASADVC